MWYSVIRWGRVPLNALTFADVQQGDMGLPPRSKPYSIPAPYDTTNGQFRSEAIPCLKVRMPKHFPPQERA
jgi:hypothetical protein